MESADTSAAETPADGKEKPVASGEIRHSEPLADQGTDVIPAAIPPPKIDDTTNVEAEGCFQLHSLLYKYGTN